MRNTCGVQHAFGTVLWIVCGIGIVVAVGLLIVSGKVWEEFGKDGLVMDRDSPQGPAAGSAAANVERDAEIRQMLQARNARRERRGEAPIDVEAELARLTAPQIDPELRQEIRELVIARNHRRERAGKPPLDVDAEVEREIARFGPPQG
jgi:hypothetical protein